MLCQLAPLAPPAKTAAVEAAAAEATATEARAAAAKVVVHLEVGALQLFAALKAVDARLACLLELLLRFGPVGRCGSAAVDGLPATIAVLLPAVPGVAVDLAVT